MKGLITQIITNGRVYFLDTPVSCEFRCGMSFAAVVVGMCVCVWCTVAYYAITTSDAPFVYHPTLMPFACLLTVSGVVLRRRASSKLVTQIHAALLALAIIAGGGGIWAIWKNKDLHSKSHLTSTHSWYGAVAGSLFIANSAIGQFKTFAVSRKRTTWQWKSSLHRACGWLGLLAAGGAMLTGLSSAWALAKMGQLVVVGLQGIVVASFLLTASPWALVNKAGAKKIP